MQILKQNPQINSAQKYTQNNQSFKANVVIKTAKESIMFDASNPNATVQILRDFCDIGHDIIVKIENKVVGSMNTLTKKGKLEKKIYPVINEAKKDSTDKLYEVIV